MCHNVCLVAVGFVPSPQARLAHDQVPGGLAYVFNTYMYSSCVSCARKVQYVRTYDIDIDLIPVVSCIYDGYEKNITHDSYSY